MKKSEVVSGGMLPKLNACKDALAHGVTRVRILPADAAYLFCRTYLQLPRQRRNGGHGRVITSTLSPSTNVIPTAAEGSQHFANSPTHHNR